MALKDDSPSAPLSTLDENEYVVAFGPNGRQFCATPNGYSAMFLPHQALTLLSQARKVTWASFGSHPDSWFFLFEDEHGNPGYTYGKEIPETLKAVFADRELGLLRPLSSLRLQLGANDSFVIWDRYKWLCNNLPNLLRAHLCQISSSVTKGDNNTTTGYFKSESLALTNITWHDSGSFYMKWGNEHSWNYQSHIMRQAWNSLWQEYEDGVLTSRELSDLAFVAIDPHASEADTVVFIKKKQGDGEANFAIHFPNEPVITRLELPERSTSTTTSKPPEDTIIPDDRLEYAAQETSQEVTYQFAKSKKSGRPHPKDSWELDLRKGETIKILQERGREWYIIENKRGIKGFAHRSCWSWMRM